MGMGWVWVGLWAWLWWLSCIPYVVIMVGLYGGGIWHIGTWLWSMGLGRDCMIANGFSNANVFSLVNELRIIKKVNLLKFSVSWGILTHNI